VICGLDIETAVAEEHVRLGEGRSARRVGQFGVSVSVVFRHFRGGFTATDHWRIDRHRPGLDALRRNCRTNVQRCCTFSFSPSWSLSQSWRCSR